MAKTIRVSSDDVTYYTLPGSTGDYNETSDAADDTIFGADFASSQPTLITWTVSANAMYRGFAGYKASVKSNGTSTSFSGEATANTSGLTYQISDSTKTLWNWTTAPTVYDNAVSVASSNYTVNYMFGSVTFVPGYSVSGPVTVDGAYYPLSDYANASGFTLTQSADTTNTTDFGVANSNGGFSTFRPTLLNADLELSGFYNSANDNYTDLHARSQIVVELNPDGDDLSVARGIYRLTDVSQSGDVGGDEEQTISLGLSVPEDVTPFAWQHGGSTTLSQGVQVLLDAWLDKTAVYVQYLPEGVDEIGREGQAYVTNISMSSDVEGLVEFDVELQGTGASTQVNS